MSTVDENYLRLAASDGLGKALLVGVGAGVAGFVAALAAGSPGPAVLAAVVGVACLYGALISGYRGWRAHYEFWSAQGLSDDEVRLKWRDLH